MKERPCLAIDFDGTLVTKGDFPKFGKLKYWAKNAWLQFEYWGYKIIVFTARKDLNDVKRFLRNEGLYPSEVTNTKPPSAWVFIDDRGLRFENNWKDIVPQVKDLVDKEKDKKLGKA